MSKKILVINMGSTSSKLAYFEDDKKVAEQSYEHAAAELIKLETVEERCAYRRPLIESFIKENNIDMTAVDAIAARGVGGGGSYKSGAYLITEEVRDECAAGNGHQGLLTSTVIGYELSQKYNIPAYLYDVVPVNEIEPIAEITGSPLFKRTGGGHTLNTRATARLVAKELGKPYDECTFVVCHMGGGISTNLQKNGRIIDIIGSSEGTFSPDRAGGVPEGPLRKLYKSGKYTEKEIGRMLNGQGGLIAYLGTNDCKERFNANPAAIAVGLERLILKAETVPAWRGGKPNILAICPPWMREGFHDEVMGLCCVEKSPQLAAHFERIADLHRGRNDVLRNSITEFFNIGSCIVEAVT